MKKILLAVALLFMTYLATMDINASSDFLAKPRLSVEAKNNKSGRIAEAKLPKTIKAYLNKVYPDHLIMIAKLKKNGYYYIKIKYNLNDYRPYYRSLVFDNNGQVVKG